MSRTLAATFAVFVAKAAAAAAPDPWTHLVDSGRAAHRPILVQLATVWSAPCRNLDRLLETPAGKAALAGLVVTRVDAERGEGLVLADRLRPTGFPTLVVLDSEGREQARAVGFSPDLPKWLATVATLATRSDEELSHEATAPHFQILAERAHTRGDQKAEHAWLTKLVHAPDSGLWMRERAAERLLASELGPRLVELLRAPLLAHAKHHAGLGSAGEALQLLTVLGVDGAALDRELVPLAQTIDPTVLGELARQALRAGALATAVAASRRWTTVEPTSVEALAMLAEAQHAEGDRTSAVATQQRALAIPKLPRSVRADLERDLVRYQRGDRRELGSWTSAQPPTLGLVGFTPPMAAGQQAEATLRRLVSSQAGRVGAACQTLAPPDLTEVYVRVTVGDAALRPARVEVMEPRGTAGFRRCIENVLRATVVPPGSLAALVVTPLTLSARP